MVTHSDAKESNVLWVGFASHVEVGAGITAREVLPCRDAPFFQFAKHQIQTPSRGYWLIVAVAPAFCATPAGQLSRLMSWCEQPEVAVHWAESCSCDQWSAALAPTLSSAFCYRPHAHSASWQYQRCKHVPNRGVRPLHWTSAQISTIAGIAASAASATVDWGLQRCLNCLSYNHTMQPASFTLHCVGLYALTAMPQTSKTVRMRYSWDSGQGPDTDLPQPHRWSVQESHARFPAG